MKNNKVPVEPAEMAHNWKIQAVLTMLGVYFYVFMEWLFFVTKPSFLTRLGFAGKLQVLLVTPVPLVAAGLAGLFLCWIPAIIARNRNFRSVCPAVGHLIPAAILASSLFMLIDNFTYTIFRFGVRSTEGVQRSVYGLLILILAVFSYKFLYDLKKEISRPALYRKLILVAPGILLLSVLVISVTCDSSGLVTIKRNRDMNSLKYKPNILLISSDGLNAENMSVYGYHRDTTPFIGKLAENALLCENCFTNADASAASIASMFTGKLPTQTRLIYAPDILKGEDAYQHLPGILRKHGYRNIDISVRPHADPVDLNMRDSFDWVNLREIKDEYVSYLFSSLLGQESFYFLRKMRERGTDRFFHVFGLRRMEDPLEEVVKQKRRLRKDSERVSSLFSFIDDSRAPFFAHLHLLGTHGPKFNPSRRLYSSGRRNTEPWMVDFYDDAILTFDGQAKHIIKGLEKRRILNNTVIVIYTDHGQRWTVNARVPLLFFFPYGDHSGHVRANVQNLDIAPTILDYLGIEQPDWMGGLSLISSEIEPHRFIFTVVRKRGVIKKTRGRRELDKSKTDRPFHSIGSVGVFSCHKLFELDLEKSILTVSTVKGHTSPCSEDDIPDPERIGRLIIDHLAGNEYDTSSIKAPLSVKILQ